MNVNFSVKNVDQNLWGDTRSSFGRLIKAHSHTPQSAAEMRLAVALHCAEN